MKLTGVPEMSEFKASWVALFLGFIVCVAATLLIGAANQSQVCLYKLRRLSDREIVEGAVARELTINAHRSEFNRASLKYDNVQAFIAANPSCCTVNRRRSMYNMPTLVQKIAGLNWMYVKLRYLKYNRSVPQAYFRRYESVDACGKVRESFGLSGEKDDPPFNDSLPGK